MNIPDQLIDLATGIKLLAVDCDGVLTDGKLYFDRHGEALKVFNVKDGQGIVSWIRAGKQFAVITARSSEALEKRCKELGIEILIQSSRDKASDIQGISKKTAIKLDEIAYIGDDLGDINAMETVGLAIAVADAVEDVRNTASLTTNKHGGSGAVREVTDSLLKLNRN